MIYSLFVTDPNAPEWFDTVSIEADSLDNAIASFYEHNSSMLIAVEYTPVVDVAALKAEIVNVVQSLLDTTAQSRGYDGIISLCTYTTSNVPRFKTEAQAGVNWRDACWGTCYQIMEDVQTGKRNLPTPEEVLAELPVMAWS